MKKTKLKVSKYSKALLYFTMLFTCMSVLGQKTISGVVSDSNGPLPGVNILVKGTSNGTQTDFDGNYSLNNVSNTDIIVFSFIGFETKEINTGNQTTINATLSEDAQSLDEVVVIGYGTSKRTDLTGAISTVSSKDFEKQPLIRVEDALQSRAAGVSVVRTTGAPGGQVKIRIRGSNSISFSNQPLIVIDGILGGTLESLNPNDVATMDILKDASASAIYGSRGANGVVVITTKKGTGKPKIGVEYFTTISAIPKELPLISPQEYADLSGIDLIDGGTDYQDEYFRTALLNNVQLNASGKEGNLSYFLSGNYVDQEGIVFNSDYNRGSLRANLNGKFGERLNIGLNIYGSREQTHNLFAGGARASSDTRGGIAAILGWDPTIPIRNPDGTYYQLQSSYGNILVNPVAVQSEKDNNTIQDRFNANLNISYDISSTLNFTLLAGSLFRHTNSENFSGIPDGTTVLEAQAGFSSSRLTTYQLSNILSWNKTFGNTNVKLTGVYELQESQNKRSSGSSGEYGIGGLRNAFYLLELGVDQGIGADQSESTIQSYVGRAEILFGDDLNLTGTMRVDQSSNFREDNRTGYFPSVSASYNIGKLLLPEEGGLLNSIKLRVGYGEVGNQDVGALATYPNLPTGRDFAFDGSTPEIGIGKPSLRDVNLTWETTKQFNAGLDFSLANNRVQFTVDWYKKNTEDLLLRKSVPSYNGGGTVLTNIGEVQNTGLDFTVNTYPVSNENFTWNSNFVLSVMSNEVIDLGGDEVIPANMGGVNPGGSTQVFYNVRVGEPLGQMNGATFLGTWKNADAADGRVPGSARYLEDENGEIILSDIGNGTPTLTWGFNNTFTYKNFDLNFLLRGVHDFQVYNITYADLMRPLGSGTGRHVDYLNRWTPTNETDIPAVGDAFNSSRYVEDGDFIRLSNLALGYTFDNLKGIKSLNVYVSGQNLFTITDYRGYDPEVSSTGVQTNDGAPSFDYGAFPNPRSFTLGARIQF